MRIQFYAMNYAPELSGTAPYTAGFAEHLAELGHDVDVITSIPHYPEWARPNSVFLADEIRNGVHVRHTDIYIPRRHSGIQRAIYDLSFLRAAKFFRTLRKPDVVIGVIPTLSDGILARLAAQHFHARYGLVFQDMISLAATQSGIHGMKRFRETTQMAERWITKNAAAVGIVSGGFRSQLEALGVPSNRLMELRNWNLTPEAKAEPLATRVGLSLPEDAFICVHAGNMGHKQDLRNIVECARLAKGEERSLFFVLAGHGTQRAELEALKAAYSLDNVRFLPQQSSQDFAELLACADVLLLNQAENVTNMSFPSKVSSYASSGRPIVAAVSSASDVGIELEREGAALIVRPNQPEELLSSIIRVKQDETLRQRLMTAATVYGRKYFSKEMSLLQWDQLVARILEEDSLPHAAERAA